jgi:hypothetical protein
MAISKILIEYFCNLKLQGKMNYLQTVLDMGDQDISGDLDYFEEIFRKYNIKFNSEEFNSAKKYPQRPRVSSSTFWKTLQFNVTHRLDIAALSRDNKDDLLNFFKVDLNFPIEQQIAPQTYDLVTDFGNNEHPFNYIEAYKSMHKLTKKNGLIFIAQQYFRGNGYVNFEPSFFESMAAVNNYKIINNFFIFNNDSKDLLTPVDIKILDIINIEKIKGIQINYLFKKTEDSEFKFPYQCCGSQFETKEYYDQIYDYNEYPISRSYLPTKIDDIGGKILFKEILKKFKKRFIK